jgi:hypothetical protein
MDHQTLALRMAGRVTYNRAPAAQPGVRAEV